MWSAQVMLGIVLSHLLVDKPINFFTITRFVAFYYLHLALFFLLSVTLSKQNKLLYIILGRHMILFFPLKMSLIILNSAMQIQRETE